MTIKDIYDAVMDFDEERVPELVKAALAEGTDVKAIVDAGMIAALDEIGARFSAGTLFVPEMLMAAEAVQAGMDILRPLLAETGAKPVGTVVIGTVAGDLHDIGKNLVGMMLEGAGFRVVDLGTDVAPQAFIDAAQQQEADLIAMSGLLTTSMAQMERTVADVAKARQSRNLNVRVMVGGPPVNDEFATRIGADGYGENAHSAVQRARSLMRESAAA